jgi:hypothetical protein
MHTPTSASSGNGGSSTYHGTHCWPAPLHGASGSGAPRSQ